MKPAAAPQTLPSTMPAHIVELVTRMREQPSPRQWLASQPELSLARVAGALGVLYTADRNEVIERILFAEWQRTAQ